MRHYILGNVVDEISVRENNPSTSDYERFVGLEHYVSGEVEIVNYGTTANLNSAMKVFQEGDILVARRNVYLKRASVVYFDGLTSGDSIVLRAKDETIGRILPFILNTEEFWDYAEKHSDGTMSKRLSPKVLKNYEFDLPEDSLDELADLLWSMVDTKKAYKELLKKTDDLVKSQFIEMFGDIENNCKGYPIKQIDEFSDLFAGATPSTKVSAYWESGTIPWMSSGEVHMGRVTSTEKKITQLGYDKCSTKMVPLHTVVIALAGQGKTRGTVAITEIELCTNQSLCAMITDGTVLSEYLFHNLNNRYEEIRNMCAIAGGRGGLNLKIVGRIKVIVPSIEEQKRFVAFAEQSDKSKFYGKSQFIEMFGNPYTNPKEWETGKLEDVMVGKASNGFFTKPANYSPDGNVGVICVGDVVNRKYSNVCDLRRATADEKQIQKFKVQYGDMLFCRSSLVKEGIAKASIVPKDSSEDVLFECHVIRVKLDLDRVIPEFMQAFTITDYFRNQMMDKSKTATMTTIGQKDVISGTIYIPDMDLQKQFVHFAAQSDKSKLSSIG